MLIVDLYLFAKSGFVVIASDYRFHGPTAKRDEWGGVDVNDVLNLVRAVKPLDFVDPERLYMLGVSRGGAMTYVAIKGGIPVKAAAVVAGPSDLQAWADKGPDLINGDKTYDGFANVWPDYEHRAAEHYRARSAVYWTDDINVPILILHSRTDKLVPVSQALRMAEALQEKGKVYALHIYDRDGHSLPLNREQRCGRRDCEPRLHQSPSRTRSTGDNFGPPLCAGGSLGETRADVVVPTQHTCPSGRCARSQHSPKLHS